MVLKRLHNVILQLCVWPPCWPGPLEAPNPMPTEPLQLRFNSRLKGPSARPTLGDGPVLELLALLLYMCAFVLQPEAVRFMCLTVKVGSASDRAHLSPPSYTLRCMAQLVGGHERYCCAGPLPSCPTPQCPVLRVHLILAWRGSKAQCPMHAVVTVLSILQAVLQCMHRLWVPCKWYCSCLAYVTALCLANGGAHRQWAP